MNPEQLPDKSSEKHSSHEAKESSERIKENMEKAAEKAEKDYEKDISQAREEIEKHALKSEESTIETEDSNSYSAPYKTKEIQEKKYRQTLQELQSKMPKAQKRFSKLIHNQSVERISEIAEKTVMKPNIVLGASVGGFIGLLVFYFVTKKYGYELSGFEYFAFLLIGALIATLFEVARYFYKKIRLKD